MRFKILFACILFTVTAVTLTGCSVSQSEYNSVIEEHGEIKANYDKLLAETEDWRRLSAEEKAQKLAEAEVEKTKAEEAAKKAKEEQAAAEAAKKAEEEKHAAAEKAVAEAGG